MGVHIGIDLGGSDVTVSRVICVSPLLTPIAAITYPADNSAIDRTLGDDTAGKIDFAGTSANASAVAVLTDVGNTGTFTQRGLATLGPGGGWTYQHTIVAGDVDAVVKVKARAFGSGGVSDSATITLAIVDVGADIVEYYDARFVTLNGADVASWTGCKNARHLTSAPGSQPAYLATGSPSGKPLLRFDGVAEYLQSAILVYNQPALAMLAAKAINDAIPADCLLDGQPGGHDTFDIVRSAGTGGDWSGYSGAILKFSPQPSSGTWYVWEYLANGNSSAVALDGGARTTGAAGASNPSGITLAVAGNLGGGWCEADYARATFCSRDLTATERSAFVAWLDRGV